MSRLDYIISSPKGPVSPCFAVPRRSRAPLLVAAARWAAAEHSSTDSGRRAAAMPLRPFHPIARRGDRSVVPTDRSVGRTARRRRGGSRARPQSLYGPPSPRAIRSPTAPPDAARPSPARRGPTPSPTRPDPPQPDPGRPSPARPRPSAARPDAAANGRESHFSISYLRSILWSAGFWMHSAALRRYGDATTEP